MIRTILIDDEEKSIKTLLALLARYCPDIEVIGEASSVEQAVKLIPELQPDLVFTDIQMPDGTGFDVLEKTRNQQFGVIFVTAFEEHALRAFRFSALHYLLKPINFEELQEAVERFRKQAEEKQTAVHEQRIDIARKAFHTDSPDNIVLPSLEGFIVVKVSDIVRCEADSNYTKIIFARDKPFMASKSLAFFEELLGGLHFVRIHHKHLVNLAHVRRYLKGRGGMVEMADGTEVEVSARKKEEFLSAVAAFARGTN